MFKKSDKILVIGAHPDDEVIGCGGTILKAKEIGCDVKILILGEGVSARFDTKLEKKKILKASKKREEEFLSSIKILRISNYEMHNYKCTKFDQYPISNFVKIIEKNIYNFKPTIIFTHHDNEVNIDHSITCAATEIACRPVKNNTVKKILSYETICSSNFKFSKNFDPNLYVDIEKFWNKKIKAFKSYKGEIRKFPFPRSLKGLQILAHYRGMQSSKNMSEAFEIKRIFY